MGKSENCFFFRKLLQLELTKLLLYMKLNEFQSSRSFNWYVSLSQRVHEDLRTRGQGHSLTQGSHSEKFKYLLQSH